MQPSNDTLNNEQTNESGAPKRREYEIFKVSRGIAGWHVIPADPQCHPLLARLFGHEPGPDGKEPQTADWDELRQPLPWSSLEDGLKRIRNSAQRAGVGVRICGNLKRKPTVLLWRLPKVAPDPVMRAFAGLHGDAAKWGVTDFYEEHEKAFRDALASRMPFDTGWYGVKKEIQTGRVFRERRGGRLALEVSASMDDWPDLVDTAVWEAAGKQLGAASGFDTLLHLGLSEADAERWMEDYVTALLASGSELGEGNSWTERGSLSGQAGFDRIAQELNTLMDRCGATLEAEYRALVEDCRTRIAELKLELGVSCRNCKHFHGAIGASQRSPEEPADCAHPKYFALLSANPSFPFEHGCKFWTARHPLKRKKTD